MESIEKMLAEMERAPDAFAEAVRGAAEAVLSRRPDENNWSARETVCHVRDTEEYFSNRFQMILDFDEPRFSPADAGRWAAERQYSRHDVGEALAAFRRRREETLAFAREIKPGQWERTCIHSVRGRMTLRDYLNLLAGHDQNHLAQIKRALEGRV
jgi:uncharacterized damage-inducible protein DinB